jgi:hypothetical protein
MRLVDQKTDAAPDNSRTTQDRMENPPSTRIQAGVLGLSRTSLRSFLPIILVLRRR